LIEKKGIAADAGGHRLDDAERESCGNRGIERITTLLQDADAGFHGQRLAARHHTIARHHHGTPGCEAGPLYTTGFEHSRSPLWGSCRVEA
jgi:hypothetical protein